MNDYAGRTFQQYARKLRIHRSGKPDFVSELAGDPTLLTIEADFDVNIDFLIGTGALKLWNEPKVKAKKEVLNGESFKYGNEDMA